jgi:hypothetical protein
MELVDGEDPSQRIARGVLGAVSITLGVRVTAQQRPEMHDMQLVGYNDLQARSAYQPVIHRQGDRWIAYIGHFGTQPNPLTQKQRFHLEW